ncbi:hypothetical protein ACLI1A_05095 [Flavobacterium sp. RHBU_3]|uniref:hypothetical protein n=1 Tax=Flavobacterium sp. RHBU_3 TaxID=3391184 RepID=UPI0039847A0D
MKRLESKRLLYDGMDTDGFYQRNHDITGLVFNIKDIIENRIEKLKGRISQEVFLKITAECGFRTNANDDFAKHFKDFDFGEFYLSNEGLELYYIISNSVLYIFSFGESQPARYKLYLEGVWEM